MTNEEIIEGNKLIAKFHGWKHSPTPKNKGMGQFHFPEWGKAGFTENNFKYHSSWDWLMPVVEKIENNCKAHITIYNKECWVEFYGIHDDPCKFHNKEKSTIENVWLSIVSFIHWYNNNHNTVLATVFCVSTSYMKGDKCLFNNIEYQFMPNERQNQFSLAIYPTDGYGWYPC